MKTGAEAAETVAEWAAATLTVPTGLRAGRPFEVEPWQKEFLAGALAPGVVEAGLSCARKNGKSGLLAAVILAHLAGPLRRPYFRVVVASLTGRLSAELRLQIEELAAASGLAESIRIVRSPQPGHVLGGEGCRCDFLSGDRSTGHGQAADLALIDECGLLEERHRGLVEAMLNSVRSREGGRAWSISIRGTGPMFGELAARAGEPGVFWREYAAPEGCPLDDEEAWAAANPGLGSINSRETLRHLARRARAAPASQAAFRRENLNQGVAESSDSIVSPAQWRACETDEPPGPEGPAYLGIDLGGASAMCAVAAYWPRTGLLEWRAALPDSPDLLQRGEADAIGSLYLRAKANGELATYPGRVTPVAPFLRDCALWLAGRPVAALHGDRYRQAELETALAAEGVPWSFEPRSMGAHAKADASAAVRAFQRAVIGGELRCRPGILLPSAIAESAIRYDGAGNPALDKARHRARIDVLSAAVLAVGASVEYVDLPDGWTGFAFPDEAA